MFSKEKILLQHSVLSYRIDLYFLKHKITIEVDELNKLNSIETLISQVLIDSEIRLKKFIAIADEKGKYEKMKENIRMMKSQKSDAKKDKLNEEEAKKIESNKIISKNNGNT